MSLGDSQVMDPLGISVTAPGFAPGEPAPGTGLGGTDPVQTPHVTAPVMPTKAAKASRTAAALPRRGAETQHERFLAKHGLTAATRGTGAQAKFLAANGGQKFAGMTPPSQRLHMAGIGGRPNKARRAAGFLGRRGRM